MKLRDIRDVDDLKQMNLNDVIDVLDELRGIALTRGNEMLKRGRVRARRAIGAPDQGAVATAFIAGILIGAAAAAVATVLWSPVPAPEARRRLGEQMERARGRVRMGDGHAYQPEASGEMGTPGGSLRQPTA